MNVETEPGRQAPYFIPLFLEGVDVLSKKEFILDDDDFVVSRRLKEKLVRAGMSGFDYSPVAMRRSLYGKSYH